LFEKAGFLILLALPSALALHPSDLSSFEDPPMPPAVPAPVLDNPLQTSTTSFNLGQLNQFSASGNNFTSANVNTVDISSSTTGISWTTGNWSVTSSTSLSLSGTPTQSPGPPGGIGDLIVTINKGQPNQNSASASNISYNAGKRR
jgi:hypothetical protein